MYVAQVGPLAQLGRHIANEQDKPVQVYSNM